MKKQRQIVPIADADIELYEIGIKDWTPQKRRSVAEKLRRWAEILDACAELSDAQELLANMN